MKPGDEVEVRVFTPPNRRGSKGRVVSVFANGDLLVERLDEEDVPAWVPRVGRFEQDEVRPWIHG